MPGKVNDLQFSVSEIKDISILNGDQLTCAAGFPLMGFLRRVHIKVFKLAVAADMVAVRMRIQ